ncbi:hypothetical protein F1188_14945 [Roseospira marina]|uniref:Uncharacterized protein n=2 Tax=Roseospira marina TaxID=140057 RepID=A0A5M6I9S2_9PROT|nr:hypothetical protein [Roseospira marina]KAA5604707.1 hypothetical protein F1188_14945 [Roseospira marina]MBB4315155.1 hypothetical protein [Roseospira marina]
MDDPCLKYSWYEVSSAVSLEDLLATLPDLAHPPFTLLEVDADLDEIPPELQRHLECAGGPDDSRSGAEEGA